MFIVSLTGNIVIGIIVYNTKTMRRPTNFFIVNMAMSDLLYPIFVIPRRIQRLYIDSFLIGGPLGQALCKLVVFVSDLSAAVSIQNLVLIAVDRFGAVILPLRFPLISSKLCPFFILATWIVAIAVNSPELFVIKLVEYPGKLICERYWNEVFGESSVLYGCTHFYPGGGDDHTLHYHLSKAQVAEDSRRAIGQRWTTTPAEGAKCVKDGHRYCVWVCSVPAAPLYPLVYSRPYGHHHMAELWHPILSPCFPFMALANCAVNPCICFIFSRKYRKELKALLK